MDSNATLAFEICVPFFRNKNGFRFRLIEIWLPGENYDWAWPFLTEKEKAYANRLIDDPFDNLQSWFSPFCAAKHDAVWRVIKRKTDGDGWSDFSENLEDYDEPSARLIVVKITESFWINWPAWVVRFTPKKDHKDHEPMTERFSAYLPLLGIFSDQEQTTLHGALTSLENKVQKKTQSMSPETVKALDAYYKLTITKPDEMRSYVRQIMRLCKGFWRPWWKHPRWRFWRWEVKVIPWFFFKRWLFWRCAHCGKGLTWKQNVRCQIVSKGYGGNGLHFDCRADYYKKLQKEQEQAEIIVRKECRNDAHSRNHG